MNYLPYDDENLLPGKFRYRDLVNEAVIFPYEVQEGGRCSYTIPSVLFYSTDDHKADAVATHWKSVQEELAKKVPGLQWMQLFPTFTHWWWAALNIHDVGAMWEDVLASSLAVRYYLTSQCNPHGPWYKFTEIYQLEATTQGAQVLSSLEVDFHQGILRPSVEVNASTHLDSAIHINSKFPVAHFDIILQTKPLVAIIQAKNTLHRPKIAAIKKQAKGSHVLLWVSPGHDEDSAEPTKFKDAMIVSKLQQHRLAFLSGAGCVSPMNMDFIILMKHLASGVP